MDESRTAPNYNPNHPALSISQNNDSPFDQFLKNPDLDMLSGALPYVSDSMRKFLALYIKSVEIHRILADFDKEEVLSACGFERNTPDPEAMLRAMKIAGGKNANPQIDQLLNMMNLIKAYRSFNEILQNNPEIASFLTNLMNQTGTNSQSKASTAAPASPADLLKQLGNQDGIEALLKQAGTKDNLEAFLKQSGNGNISDMVSLFSQMMKKS